MDIKKDFKFQRAIGTLLEHEGLLADDMRDRGGTTMMGISLGFLKMLPDEDRDGFLDGDLNRDGAVNRDDVLTVTRERAKQIYRHYFWNRYGYAQFDSAEVAAKVFDLSVVMGPGSAHKCVQRALRAMGLSLSEDGILGPVTFSFANGVGIKIMPPLREAAAGHFRCIAARDSTQEAFLDGWLAQRAYS